MRSAMRCDAHACLSLSTLRARCQSLFLPVQLCPFDPAARLLPFRSSPPRSTDHRDDVRDSVTGVDDGTGDSGLLARRVLLGEQRGAEGQNGLHGNVQTGNVERLEHNLSGVLAIVGSVERRLSQKEIVLTNAKRIGTHTAARQRIERSALMTCSRNSPLSAALRPHSSSPSARLCLLFV